MENDNNLNFEDNLDFSKKAPEEKGVNYADTFDSIYGASIKNKTIKVKEEPKIDYVEKSKYDDLKPSEIEAFSFRELKVRAYNHGFNLKPYINKNTPEYYSNKFFYSNKLSLHAVLVMFALIITQIFVIFFSAKSKLSYSYTTLGVALALSVIFPIAFGIKYYLYPNKKKRIKFNLKNSLINSAILTLNLVLLIILIGFFAFSATTSNASTMWKYIYIPLILTINIPLFSFIIALFVKMPKYHLI